MQRHSRRSEMISLRACCCSDHLVKLCRKRGASVTLSRWRRTTDSNVGRQGSEACRQDRGPRTDSGRFQRAGSSHSSGPIRHVAVKATSAPSDLQARPLLRHERIDLPPEPGIQEVFRHLANDANRTRVVGLDSRRLHGGSEGPCADRAHRHSKHLGNVARRRWCSPHLHPLCRLHRLAPIGPR